MHMNLGTAPKRKVFRDIDQNVLGRLRQRAASRSATFEGRSRGHGRLSRAGETGSASAPRLRSREGQSPEHAYAQRPWVAGPYAPPRGDPSWRPGSLRSISRMASPLTRAFSARR